MRKIALLPTCLFIGFLFAACGPSPEELNASATQVADVIFATQTATLPTPAPVLVPTFRLEPDGSGDYATLEEAVRRAPEGAIIELGPGLFRLETRLYVRKSLHLVGAGMDQTEIVSEAEGHVVRFSGGGPFTVEDITFRHEGGALASVVVVQGGDVVFTRCRFAGAFSGAGEYDRAGLWLRDQTNGTVSDCVAEENDDIGIYVSGLALPTLERNLCMTNTVAGIAYWGYAGGVLRQNECVGNYFGIAVGRKAQPAVEENICNDNEAAGILFIQDAGGIVRQNECLRNETGISITDQAQPTLEGNTCNENKADGIGYDDQSGGVARENECVGNGIAGIAVKVTANPSLMGNDCYDNGGEDIEYLRP
jgi:parallel beta-helix repeat protein